mgnify:CR=1 FL=1|jgi:hypothetical protein
MNFRTFYEKLKSEFNISVAYDHFESKPTVPFIVFLDEGKRVYAADNINYFKFNNIRVELYTDRKDLELEEQLENFFNRENLIFVDDGSTYIEDEKLYVHYYHI